MSEQSKAEVLKLDRLLCYSLVRIMLTDNAVLAFYLINPTLSNLWKVISVRQTPVPMQSAEI